MISVSQLKMVFGKRVVLDRVDFRVGEGEVFGITGMNGSGKTILMKILATLLKPTAGKVRISGYDVVKDRNRVRSLIGYMPDSTGFDDRLSVKEYLDFFLSMYWKNSGRTGLNPEALLDAVGLHQMDGALISHLSKGVRQRISLVRAMIHNPSVLLLDDPDMGMDQDGLERMYSLLKDLRDQGKSMVIASHATPHFIQWLNRVAHRIGVFHQGRLRLIFPAGVESPALIYNRVRELEALEEGQS